MGSKPELLKYYYKKQIQNKNCSLLRCIDAKCHNERYTCKIKECLELRDKLHHSQQGREKVQELKEKNYRAVFKKREHIC